jgi:Xaa-Pro aminopeptidase
MSKLLHHLSFFLFLMPGLLLAQEGAPFFTENFSPEEFIARRAKLAESIGSQAVAILQGAPAPAGYTRFRQSNEFFYLTGVEVPHAYVLIDGRTGDASLYLPHRNAGREIAEGKMLSAEDVAFIEGDLGFAGVYGPELLSEHLARLARGTPGPTIYTPFSPAEGASMSRDLALRAIADAAADPWDASASREGQFIEMLGDRFPSLPVADLSPILDEMRLVKSDRELEMIRIATRLSGLGLMEAMRSTEPGVKESQLDAVAKYVYYRDGAQGDAYFSLVASATNAYYPHYHEGARTMKDGDMVLMDYAPDVGYYMSDLTRVWPVNGTFNDWQRELYSFYLSCYRAVLTRIRPGVTPAAIGKEAVADMKVILTNASFSKPEYRQAAEEFVASYDAGMDRPGARLGHWVGMSTHDVGNYSGPLMPGMVFTIEPALRVPEERIYIRMEDLIIITENGAEIVSDFVPMDIDAIERLMQDEGLLQRYPPEQLLLSLNR